MRHSLGMRIHAKKCCTAFFCYSEGACRECAPPFGPGVLHPVDAAPLACYLNKIIF